MSSSEPDKLHYIRIPKGMGGRAEMARMAYVLAGRAYVDVLCSFAEAKDVVSGKNPFKQFPFVETPSGKFIYQTPAILHHATHGTSAWPADPDRLTEALAVATGAYDLYQAFGAFPADDLVAKKKFEERRAPQYFNGLDEIYAGRAFAAGDTPTFADCMVHEGVAWCARRNDVCRELLQSSRGLSAFMDRFRAVPVIRDFMARQAAARESDDSL
jgi:glutathione S-transferase